jgi:hypothetical protein
VAAMRVRNFCIGIPLVSKSAFKLYGLNQL